MKVVHDDVFRRLCRARDLVHERSAEPLTVAQLARSAGVSRYHFLRLFRDAFGATPHQYLLRARLRAAATRLATEPARILDVALDAGFGDVSNFNRAFRAEFGGSPRVYRQHRGR